MSYSILGTGRAAPEYILDNARLSEMVDTSDEWITARTGIRYRHICTTETLTELTAKAARAALAQAGLCPGDLNMIFCATMQGDYITPSLACMLQEALGATCPAMDINAACSGFVYALDVAAGYYLRGRVRHVLVAAAECMSKHIDWADRSTCVLFGDGAGAVVLGPGQGLLSTVLSAQGNASTLRIEGTSSSFPGAAPRPEQPTLRMNGQEVYRFAVKEMCANIQEALKAAGVSMEQVRYVIAHQANRRILEAARERLGILPEQLVVNLDRFGNTSAASIPIALDEVNQSGGLSPGDLVVFCAFGGGLTSAAAVIRWGAHAGDKG